jgi:adenine-specific DNA methylase
VKAEIGTLCQREADGSVPVGYIWARTVKCPNPLCGVEIPLIHQFWLANKSERKVALRLIPDRKSKAIRFKITTETGTANEGTLNEALYPVPYALLGQMARLSEEHLEKGRRVND